VAGFTLIHGSTQNATAWTDVADRLRRAGHTVSVPDLPKHESSWTLARYADFIRGAIPPANPRLVVAHSFCGVFLPLLASSADCLVFEAAVVPEPGRSVYDQFVNDRTMFSEAWIAAGARWFDPSEHATLAREFLFHDCEPEMLPAALATVDLFDTRHLTTESSPLVAWPEVRCASIVCSADRTLSPEWSRRIAEQRLAVRPIEIAAGHCPHTSRPDDIAAILHQLADDTGPLEQAAR
jgi:pimeloyl-ACP methyl ester carboxylesterase